MPLDPPVPEVALVGRSNVGKSSLLNALAGRRLARISATPGKTRTLNVYAMGLGRAAGRNAAAGSGRADPAGAPGLLALYLLDLPGYGYARASQADRAALAGLVRRTLERGRLAGVVWLLDLRRVPSSDDRAMHELFAARETRVLAALTKSDKLPRGERRSRERELCAALELDADQAIVTSARSGEGIAALRTAIGALSGDGAG